jgi:hypothetical protein
MQCKQCNGPLQREDWVASISGSIMGDEHTDSYFLCPACNVYTVATAWDNFTGTETTSLAGPFPKLEGDQRVALIRQCQQPWDKKCRCAAHLAYFNNTLD